MLINACGCLENLYIIISQFIFGDAAMDVKLIVDGKEIGLNEFVTKILGGAIVGAVATLKGVKEDWKEIDIKIKR